MTRPAALSALLYVLAERPHLTDPVAIAAAEREAARLASLLDLDEGESTSPPPTSAPPRAPNESPNP